MTTTRLKTLYGMERKHPGVKGWLNDFIYTSNLNKVRKKIAFMRKFKGCKVRAIKIERTITVLDI